ncbi:MAG: threonine/serine exporter family protein [Lachnospiraceae bacterium]|nr:threonine/serine exporter family protein [Lachnospiraceae bacterium]
MGKGKIKSSSAASDVLRQKEDREEKGIKNLQYLVDFALKFSEAMLSAGANLERVNDTIYRICDSYDCRETHFFSLNCYLTLSLEDSEGNHAGSQRCVRGGMDTHLENLSKLNQLSREICANTPAPRDLEGLLAETLRTDTYSTQVRLLGFMIAMTCLTLIFGGSWKDIITVLLNTVLMYFASIYLKKPGVNRMVFNIFCTFMAGTVAIVMSKIGLVDDIYIVMIANSMMLIPGIPMVNAFRNLLCGNEINGMLEILKTMLETVAIVGGFVLSIFLIGGLIPW